MLIKDIPVIPKEYIDFYINHMAQRESEVYRFKCSDEDFTFPDGMEYPVWLLDIAMKTELFVSDYEANKK
tara:strand:+ start:242 stop:451 length:210 start_codon:yes stop_codon:yes gene_type:complete